MLSITGLALGIIIKRLNIINTEIYLIFIIIMIFLIIFRYLDGLFGTPENRYSLYNSNS